MVNKSEGIRFRAFFIGTILSVIVVFMGQYSRLIGASSMSIDHMPLAGIFLFFVLIIGLNPLLTLINPQYKLNPAELLFTYIMLLVTCTISTMGLGMQLLPVIAAPIYFASPENRWAEMIHPHLRSWLHPDEEAARYFFEGLPDGESIPWASWITPLLGWFVFILALYLVMLFVMVILRKQWVEREKLAFPLIQLPVEMVRDDENESLIKPLFKNKLFWLAMAIPVIISSLNALNSYFPAVPTFPLLQQTNIFQGTTRLRFRISFPIMGFTYLINQDVAMGVWVINLMYLIARGTFNVTGVTSTEVLGIYGAEDPIFKNFGTGAFLTYVFVGLWMARSHLKDVFGKAVGKRKEIDDSDEIVSYKTAVWGLVIGLVVMTWFLMYTGMSLTVAVIFLIFMMVFFIGLTKIIAEAGLATMISADTGSGQVVSSFGSANISQEGMVALGLTYIYSADIRTFPMSAMAQGLKVGDWIKQRRKGGMFLAMLIAIIIAYFLTNYLQLVFGHREGVSFVGSHGTLPFEWLSQHIRYPREPNRFGWMCRGSGAAVMLLLILARFRFLWWPLHPIGAAVGGVRWIDELWFSIFLVWLVKAIILKYGGVTRYRQGKAFFMGLILGQYSIGAVWFLIDMLTGQTGNRVFWI